MHAVHPFRALAWGMALREAHCVNDAEPGSLYCKDHKLLHQLENQHNNQGKPAKILQFPPR